MFSFKKLKRSLKYAFRGLRMIFKEEQSFRVQLTVGLIMIIMACYFPLMNWERVALIMMITLVLILEVINSMFEKMVDILKPRVHHYVESIKDMMAGAVLLASLASIIVGILILLPHFLNFLDFVGKKLNF